MSARRLQTNEQTPTSNNPRLPFLCILSWMMKVGLHMLGLLLVFCFLHASLHVASATCNMDGNVFLDIGDGDEKMVTVADGMITIVPHGNNETWKVTAAVKGNLAGEQCTALVDFDVPGKPNPPPIKLLISYWPLGNSDGSLQKGAWEFTDPGDKVSPPTPLNEWVMYPAAPPSGSTSAWPCPTFAEGVMRDMGDGDTKRVGFLGNILIIGPHNNGEKWLIESVIDPKSCSAVVNFAVPGKPNPPPCKLVATLWRMSPGTTGGPTKDVLEFTDPTNACEFGEPGSPLNEWVSVPERLQKVQSPPVEPPFSRKETRS